MVLGLTQDFIQRDLAAPADLADERPSLRANGADGLVRACASSAAAKCGAIWEPGDVSQSARGVEHLWQLRGRLRSHGRRIPFRCLRNKVPLSDHGASLGTPPPHPHDAMLSAEATVVARGWYFISLGHDRAEYPMRQHCMSGGGGGGAPGMLGSGTLFRKHRSSCQTSCGEACGRRCTDGTSTRAQQHTQASCALRDALNMLQYWRPAPRAGGLLSPGF